MDIFLITNENADSFTGFIPQVFLDNELLLGVACADGDEVIGAAVVEPMGNNLTIRWLYVLDGYRKQGAGSLMMDHIMEMARAQEAEFLDIYFQPAKENYEGFFIKNGFLMSRMHPVYSFRLCDVTGSRFIRNNKKNLLPDDQHLYGYRSFEQLPKNALDYIRDDMIMRNGTDYVPICCKKLSFACGTWDHLMGYIVVIDDEKEKELNVAFIVSTEANTFVAFELLMLAGYRAYKTYPLSYKVSFAAVLKKLVPLTEKLLGTNSDMLKYVGDNLYGFREVTQEDEL